MPALTPSTRWLAIAAAILLLDRAAEEQRRTVCTVAAELRMNYEVKKNMVRRVRTNELLVLLQQ